MRIKPVVVTGAATLVALSAVAVVVFSTTPDQASVALIRLFWTAVFLSLWGCASSLLFVARQTIACAVWVAFVPALAASGLLFALHRNSLDTRLLGCVLFATLILSSLLWRRLGLSKNDEEPA